MIITPFIIAAGCSREVIQRGADMLGWSLDELIEQTIEALLTASKSFWKNVLTCAYYRSSTKEKVSDSKTF